MVAKAKTGMLFRTPNARAHRPVAEPPEQMTVYGIHRKRKQLNLLIEEHLHHRPPNDLTLPVTEARRRTLQPVPGAFVKPVTRALRRRISVVPFNMLLMVLLAPTPRITR